MAEGKQGKNFRALIKAQAAAYGDKEFIYDVAASYGLTYKAYGALVERLAAYFRRLGLKPGESLGYAMDNSWQSAAIIGAALYGGLRAVPINLVSGEDNIGYVTEHSECRHIISDETHLPLMRKSCGLRLSLADEVIAAAEKHEEVPADILPDEGLSEQDIGLLIYTSGTTARPKGVLLSHKNLYHGGYNCVLAHELTANDKALCSLPFYHINGFCVTLIAPLISGGAVVVDKKFSVNRFWDIIATHQCSWFSLVPTQIAYLTHAECYRDFDKRRTACMRFGRSASSALAPDLQKRFEEKFAVKIVETMGLSETAAQILSNPLPSQPSESSESDGRKSGSAGIAYGNRVMIADKDGKEVAAGVEGEICVKGDNVMRGYFKNDAANAEAWTRDGWLKTGDLGYCDAEGYVFVTGRAKELIIKGGENIAPREIDEVLLQFGGIIEAAAFAVKHPTYGESVAAAVVKENLKEPSSMTEPMMAEALLAHCRKHLGGFKSPDKIYFFDELPKGPSGKIQRLKLGLKLADIITPR